jgi:hypothetical protein
MAQSKRFQRGLRLACIAALGLAFASEGLTSAPSGAPRARADAEARVSLMAEPGACKPGIVEAILNDWLYSTRNSEFESDYAAMAFDELVGLVHLLRDIAQDFCV